MQTIRNRHLAEWRFLLFTVIVMVKLPICTVKVMGICSPPLRRCSQPPIRFMAMLFPAPCGVGFILSRYEKNVKWMYGSFSKNYRITEGKKEAGKRMGTKKPIAVKSVWYKFEVIWIPWQPCNVWYNEYEKSTADKRLARVKQFYILYRNRHLAEWRFLLFTVIVMVKLPICTVKVIGICSPPLRRCS